MSRDLTAGVQAEVIKPLVTPIILYEGEFPSGTTRLWSGIGPLTWNSQVWTGGGQVLTIGEISETVEVKASGIEVQLSGVPASLLSLALGEMRIGKRGRLWLGFLDSAGAIEADPYLLFEGMADVPLIEEAGESATITMAYEHRLISMMTPNERRYTDQDQREQYPDDRGFGTVAALQDKELIW